VNRGAVKLDEKGVADGFDLGAVKTRKDFAKQLTAFF
jgi:hypothetical protein